MNAEYNVDIKTHYRHRGKKSLGRLYIFHGGESGVENFLLRKMRPVDWYKECILPIVREQLQLPNTVKFEWRQKAGCACPCSPGFIIKGAMGYTDVHVTVTGKAPTFAI